ncbi:MAG: ABC transporter substrate-binding protein [Myxococcales bacterium]|nr:ABC transporter substrate-binding protein [Myxococcales bacterium]
MKNRIRIGATVAALLSLLIGGRASALADSPMAQIKRSNTRLNNLLRKKTITKKIKKSVKREVGGFLDFQELARRSLGRHWAKRSAKEQSEFVRLLTDLIEANYVKQLKGNLGYKLEYRKEKVSGDSAHVTTAVKVTKNGRTEEVVIEYKMKRKNGRWLVYDVITDDVSVVRNYRSQFNRIISKKSYEHLVKKMRAKLQKI